MRSPVNSFFAELVPRLKSIELTGKPEHIATIFVGGLKHLPIRYSRSSELTRKVPTGPRSARSCLDAACTTV